MINKRAIEIAFKDDNEISNFCDPEMKEKKIADLVEGVYEKLDDYKKFFANVFFSDVRKDGDLIGFVFYTKKPNLLVSFGVNKKNRNAHVLKNLFISIQKYFNGEEFDCFMYDRNTRALNWLKKCGMNEVSKSSDLVKLNYKKCQ